MMTGKKVFRISQGAPKNGNPETLYPQPKPITFAMAEADISHVPDQHHALLRLTYFSIYLTWNMAPDRAAHRAGYPQDQVDDPAFLESLLVRSREAGLIAQTEVSPRDLFATQIHNNWAHIINTRDNPDVDDKTRLMAAIKGLELAGQTRDNRPFDPKDVIEREMDRWTKKEIRAYFLSGGTEFPRQHSDGASEARGEFEEAEVVESGPDEVSEKDPAHPNRGMLA